MTDRGNSISEEATIKAMFGEWDGAPHSPPDYIMRAWFIDPYWYVCTSDGIHRVINDPSIVTHEDLVWCVGEQMRILTLEQYRKEVGKE